MTIFEAAGGEAGILRLAEAWHRRVLADEVVEPRLQPRVPARPHRAARRVLGGGAGRSGPRTAARMGDETAVLRLHAGNGEHAEMDARAIACFDRALEDAGLASDERLRAALHAYFAWATTEHGPLPRVARRGPRRAGRAALVVGRRRSGSVSDERAGLAGVPRRRGRRRLGGAARRRDGGLPRRVARRGGAAGRGDRARCPASRARRRC